MTDAANRKALDGTDMPSFEELLEKIRQRIYVKARSERHPAVRAAAEDLTQDVMMVLTQKYSHLRKADELLFKAFRTFTNTRNAYTRKVSRHKEDVAPPIDDVVKTTSSSDPDPEELLTRKQWRTWFWAAWAQLTPRCQKLLALKSNKVPSEEIAKRLKFNSPNHVDVTASRCRGRFRQVWSEMKNDTPTSGSPGTPLDAANALVGCYPFDLSSRTPAERTALALAALDDQALFDELLEDQEILECLEDSEIRQTIVASLEDEPSPVTLQFPQQPARRRLTNRAWALPAAASFLVGAALTAAVLRQMSPSAPDLNALSAALTAAPSVTLEGAGTRGDDGASIVQVPFSKRDSFVRIVVPLAANTNETVSFAIKRNEGVVWEAVAPIVTIGGQSTATAVVPTSLLNREGANLALGVWLTNAPDDVRVFTLKPVIR